MTNIDFRMIGDSCERCGGNLSEVVIGEKAEDTLVCEYCDREEIEEIVSEYINE